VALSFQLSSYNNVPHNFVQLIRAHAAVVIALALGIVVGATLPSPAASGPMVTQAALAAVPVPESVTTVLPTTVAPETTVPPSTAPPSPPPPATAPQALPLALPTGKGMWIYEPRYAEEGDPVTIVMRARAVGLTHLYVRTGSSVDGFTSTEFLDALLPVAHANGVRIIGWDFPYLDDVGADATRAVDAITYTTPTGDRLDGFSADIETRYEGVALTAENAATYGSMLRNAVGPNYPLIATVPRPSPQRQLDYPYAEVVASFDAIAPMVYWIDVSPVDAAGEAVGYLGVFGKPVLPVGQAYDSSYEGGAPGTPTPADIAAFIDTSTAYGATGVSFWSWQHASEDTWNTIAAAPEMGAPAAG
jgi:hypothetical protein